MAAVALTLLDLTDLREDCTPRDIEALCERARTPYGDVAAICILPRFIPQARSLLGADSPVRIATVVNFPAGSLSVAEVVSETEKAIEAGADEIDLVIPYRALAGGDEQAVADMITAVRDACAPPVLLKSILETGELKDAVLIRRASEIAIEAGSDFLKSSSGRVAVNATLEAADIMLLAIRDSRRKVGLKPSGGIRSVAEAALYLRLAATIMGEDWVIPSTFRFGASALLDDVLSVLANGKPIAAGTGY
ncbi:deoxyribose-phosphate aldolase [Pseudomonas sp. R2.Fl]|nr:deoxyribose-phosphate aldolase [Pseudomonas sp. R2.Fl]